MTLISQDFKAWLEYGERTKEKTNMQKKKWKNINIYIYILSYFLKVESYKKLGTK